jgi:LPXTG-motif cell wall-anchored protein
MTGHMPLYFRSENYKLHSIIGRRSTADKYKLTEIPAGEKSGAISNFTLIIVGASVFGVILLTGLIFVYRRRIKYRR